MVLLDLVLAVPYDISHLFGLLEHVTQRRNQMGVEEDGLRARGHHGMPQTLLAKRVVGSHNGHRLRGSGVKGSEPVGTRGSKNVHPVTRHHAQLPQTSADVKGQCLIVIECDILIGTQFEVGPGLVDFLLLAIDDLLDLLGLLVSADEASRPHAFGIAVLGDTHAQELVGGGDVLGGFRDQAILGQGVPARFRLAWDVGSAGRFDRVGATRPFFGLQDVVPELGVLPRVLCHDAMCAEREYLDGDDDAMDLGVISKARRLHCQGILEDDVSQQRCGLGSSARTRR